MLTTRSYRELLSFFDVKMATTTHAQWDFTHTVLPLQPRVIFATLTDSSYCHPRNLPITSMQLWCGRSLSVETGLVIGLKTRVIEHSVALIR